MELNCDNVATCMTMVCFCRIFYQDRILHFGFELRKVFSQNIFTPQLYKKFARDDLPLLAAWFEGSFAQVII